MLWEHDLTEGYHGKISNSCIIHYSLWPSSTRSMLPFLGLCPPLTLTILTLGSSVPAMALGPLISTSWLFGRHWPSIRGREIEPKDLISLVFHVFLSVPASRASGVALLERKGASQGWKTRGVCLLGCSTLGCENELQRQTDLLQCLTWAPSQTHAKEARLSGMQPKQDKQLILLSHTPFSPEAQQRRGPVTIL